MTGDEIDRGLFSSTVWEQYQLDAAAQPVGYIEWPVYAEMTVAGIMEQLTDVYLPNQPAGTRTWSEHMAAVQEQMLMGPSFIGFMTSTPSAFHSPAEEVEDDEGFCYWSGHSGCASRWEAKWDLVPHI